MSETMFKNKRLILDDLHACRGCGEPVVHYRGRVTEPMEASNLYRRHLCRLERASLGFDERNPLIIIEHSCGQIVCFWEDGSQDDWPALTPHDHRAAMDVQAQEAARVKAEALAVEKARNERRGEIRRARSLGI